MTCTGYIGLSSRVFGLKSAMAYLMMNVVIIGCEPGESDYSANGLSSNGSSISEMEIACISDLDHNGDIDLADLQVLISQMGQTCDANNLINNVICLDLSMDNKVDLSDVALFANVYHHDQFDSESAMIDWCTANIWVVSTEQPVVPPLEMPAVVPMPTAPPAGQSVAMISVKLGKLHSCALDTTGDVWCWGANFASQLGLGPNALKSQTVAQRINMSALGDGNEKFVQISAGAFFTCGVTTHSQVACWGSNMAGEMGNDDGIKFKEPTWVTQNGTVLSDFKAVRAGAAHVCGVKHDGQVHCWGWDVNGQAQLTLESGQSMSTVSPLAVGDFQSCTALDNGLLHCSGRFTLIPAGTTPIFHSVIAGGNSSCGVDASSSAWCWGANFYGELGLGHLDKGELPTMIIGSDQAAIQFSRLSLGERHSCAITESGEMVCWGDNTYSQLGNGDGGEGATSSLVPAPVPMDSMVAETGEKRLWYDVAAGGFHSCGVDEVGAVWCWGYNQWGQLGAGTRSQVETYTQRVQFVESTDPDEQEPWELEPNHVMSHYSWLPPSNGSIVNHYVIETQVGDDTASWQYSEESPTNAISIQLEVGVQARVRVAGVDLHNRQGPFSEASDWFTP